MISGFGFPFSVLNWRRRCSVAPRSIRERGMTKMRGIVALCVALTVGLGSSALLAQKADPQKEVKRTKAEQVDIDTLVTVVDAVAAGRAAPPANIPQTWEATPFFPPPHQSTHIPSTATNV